MKALSVSFPIPEGEYAELNLCSLVWGRETAANKSWKQEVKCHVYVVMGQY